MLSKNQMSEKKTPNNSHLSAPDEAESFESALVDLQQIVTELEGGELTLSESLQRYETGIRRLKQCHEFLTSAEQKVSQLVGYDAAGNPVLEALEVDASDDLVEKQKTRQKRRSAKPATLQGASGSQTAGPRGGKPTARESVDDSPELF